MPRSHQDESFLFGDARRRVQQLGGGNLVIALDPSDAENGGFEVLGRTHQGPPVDVPYDTSTKNGGLFDESRRVLSPLAPATPYLVRRGCEALSS